MRVASITAGVGVMIAAVLALWPGPWPIPISLWLWPAGFAFSMLAFNDRPGDVAVLWIVCAGLNALLYAIIGYGIAAAFGVVRRHVSRMRSGRAAQ